MSAPCPAELFAQAESAPEEKPGQKALRIEETQVTAEREQQQEQGYAVEDTTTATKTDTPIFDLPVSIQVVPHKVIEDQQVIRLQDALKNVSGVYQAFNSGIGELSYGLRGFDQDAQYEDGFRLPFAPHRRPPTLSASKC